MPVNAAQALITIKGSGPTRKGLMIENLLVDIQNQASLLFNKRRVLIRQGIKRLFQMRSIPEIRMKMTDTLYILYNDTPVGLLRVIEARLNASPPRPG